jgi:signal transduction histidine kinase
VPAVVGDARKIEQVLQNILGNAVKFSPFHTTVRVAVRAEGEGALVVVADEGPGIPPDELVGIFKPFHRGTPRGTAGERSTGLGLAIAKRVMDGHGGRLWCESVVGEGSTFYAWLPARRASP